MQLSFGEQVKIILKRQGITIKELANRIEERSGKKMSRQNLTQRLGRDNFQEQDMFMIAQALGCSLTISLVDGEIEQEQEQEAEVIREAFAGDTAAEAAGSEAAAEEPVAVAEVDEEEFEEDDFIEEVLTVEDLDGDEAAETDFEDDFEEEELLEEDFEESDLTEEPEDFPDKDELLDEDEFDEEDELDEEDEDIEDDDEDIEDDEELSDEEKEMAQLSPETREIIPEEIDKAERKDEARDDDAAYRAASDISREDLIKELNADIEALGDSDTVRLDDIPERSGFGADPEAESAFEREKETLLMLQREDRNAELPAEQLPSTSVNPYTLKEYKSNTVRAHATRIGYVQVYSRADHSWTDMTEWAFMGEQDRRKALLGDQYEEPTYLD